LQGYCCFIYPIEHDGSDPDRTRGICIVPNRWKPKSSTPSVKNGISHRIWDPRNKSADPRKGALGVLRKLCLLLAFDCIDVSKIETKLGLKLLGDIFYR